MEWIGYIGIGILVLLVLLVLGMEKLLGREAMGGGDSYLKLGMVNPLPEKLIRDFAASVKAGEESVAQVSGVREQAILTQAIRSELKTQGVLGRPEVTMTALSPVWLDSRSRYLRDMYRPGMVMEQWNPETRSHDRYVIDRVTAQSHSLTLRDAQGETQVVRISSLDSSWSLFRPEKMELAF